MEILDCTLRDAGYINNWNFSDREIISIVESGYLNDKKDKYENSTLFNSLDILDENQAFNKFIGEII